MRKPPKATLFAPQGQPVFVPAGPFLFWGKLGIDLRYHHFNSHDNEQFLCINWERGTDSK